MIVDRRARCVFVTATHVLVSYPVGGPYRPANSNRVIDPVRRVTATPRVDAAWAASGMRSWWPWPQRLQRLP